MEAKQLIEEFPEFRYTYGDPRPILMRYMLSMSGVTSYMSQTDLLPGKPYTKAMFKHTCMAGKTPGKIVRGLVTPPEDNVKAFVAAVRNSTDGSFVIIPLMYVSKSPCKVGVRPDKASHLMYGLFNRVTMEFERIDVKKYHLKGYNVKLSYKNILSDQLLAKLEDALEPDREPDREHPIDVVAEHDVTPGFLRKFKTKELKYVFPLYLITYLHLRVRHPDKRSDDIVKHMYKVPKTDVIQYWQHYASFRRAVNSGYVDKCPLIKNWETGRCLQQTTADKLLATPPVKDCPDGKLYDMLKKRCVDKNKLTQLNILLDEISKLPLKKNAKFVSIGSSSGAIASALFVMSKHPNGLLVYDTEAVSDIKIANKENYSIIWRSDYEGNKEFKLSMPVNFWTAWEKGIMAPQRFLVTLVSLVSEEGGFHANVLIYDKEKNEIERFDGLGAGTALAYGLDTFDTLIKDMFKKEEGVHVPVGMRYFTPKDYCPKKMKIFQSRELNELGFDDLTGNCAVWARAYIDMRLSNPHLTRRKLINYAMTNLDTYGSFSKYIKRYQKYLQNGMRALSKNTTKLSNAPALQLDIVTTKVNI